jgi:hypothetical protein
LRHLQLLCVACGGTCVGGGTACAAEAEAVGIGCGLLSYHAVSKGFRANVYSEAVDNT